MNYNIVTCPGLDGALLGTHDNDVGLTVPVYSIERIVGIFKGDRQSALEWVARIEESWDPSIMPVFMNEQPWMSAQASRQVGMLN